MKKHSSKHYELKAGPALHLRFDCANEMIAGITLHLHSAKGMSWEIVGSEAHSSLNSAICQWIEHYTRKQNSSVILPYSLQHFTPYARHVFTLLEMIPFGSTMTYQEAAAATGKPKAARAVGNVCGRNLFPLIIPCHRILASGSKIGGFSAGLEIKQRLLAFEGIKS